MPVEFNVTLQDRPGTLARLGQMLGEPEFPEPTAVEAAGIRHRYIRPRRLQHNGKMPVLSITDPDRGTEGQS